MTQPSPSTLAVVIFFPLPAFKNMYILSGSLTSFVCAPSPAHPWPRSARPRLAEPSPHFGGALGNTARTPRRRDWTDGDDWQRPGPRDWLPFRPPAQRGSAPAAPPGPPAPPPEVALAKLRAGPDGAHRAPPPPPAPGSSCPCSPGAGRGALLRCSAVFTFAGPWGFSPRLVAAHAHGCCPALRCFLSFLLFLEGHVHSRMRRESTPSCNDVRNPTPTRGRGCVYSCPRHY